MLFWVSGNLYDWIKDFNKYIMCFILYKLKFVLVYYKLIRIWCLYCLDRCFELKKYKLIRYKVDVWIIKSYVGFVKIRIR